MKLRDYQQKGVNDIRNEYIRGNHAPLFVLPTGGGKCLAKGTEVIMLNGETKKVENIKVNDVLIGPDSKKRIVTSICKGKENLYKITPIKGDSFTVNESHILSFKISGKDNVYCNGIKYKGDSIANISVLEYLNSNDTFKHVAKIWRTGVDFDAKYRELPINPYLLGLWLGDGARNKCSFCFHNDDFEVIEYLYKYADINNLNIRKEYNSENSNNYHLSEKKHSGRGGSAFNNNLKKIGVYKNKHIPFDYLTSSKTDRLSLLAGLMDSDGHNSRNGFDYITVSEKLCNNILYLCRSLGLAAYKSKCVKKIKSINFEGTYYRISISGNTEIIPTKLKRKQTEKRKQIKSVLRTGVKSIECLGIGDYYGFELKGNDRLFLLGDFTVTHNTVVFCHVAQTSASKQKNVLILVHRVELLRQTSRALKRSGVEHGLINPKYTPNLHAPVQVASVQTLVNRLERINPPDLIIVDEAHHATAGSWRKVIDYFPMAKVLGVTATPIRGDGKGLNAMFDCLVMGPQISELIDMGFLVKPVIYAPPKKIDLSNVKIVRGDYDKKEVVNIMDKPTITGDAVQHYKKLCSGVPAVVFCVSVIHAENVAEQFRLAGYTSYSVDGSMDDDTRSRILNGLGDGSIQVVTSCDLISEGTDIPAIGCAILLRPTYSKSLYLQQVGRALRLSEGKKEAIILDHVGNVMEHGFPDDEQQWTLDGTKKGKRKKKDNEETVKADQCESCYAVYEPADYCPYCGFENKKKKQREVEEVAGNLERLEREEQQKKARKEVGKARSLEALLEVAKQRGYKPSWAHHVFKARQNKK